MRCAAIKDGGERCKALAMEGATHCYAHDPRRADERRRNAKRAGEVGGNGRGRPRGELAQVRLELRRVIEDVRANKLGTGAGSVLSQLYGTLLRCIEQERRSAELEELVERLETLERARGLRSTP